MNPFDRKYGNGTRWYLNLENYSDAFLDDEKRQAYIRHFYAKMEDHNAERRRKRFTERLPAFIVQFFRPMILRRKQRIHFGQVVPSGELAELFERMGKIRRLACLCRFEATGQEWRTCYSLSIEPDGGRIGSLLDSLDAPYLNGPAVQGIETLTAEEEAEDILALEKKELVHTIWTLHSPYTAIICNCDQSECNAMKYSMKQGPVPSLYRAAYIAEVDAEKCIGCKKCMTVCQFGAIEYSPANKQVSVYPKKCFGCGICRTACSQNAVALKDRADFPEAKDTWLAR